MQKNLLLVFLDFQKAFDTINHKILIAKHNHYGMRGMTLDCFQSYLTKKSSINNVLSNETVIHSLQRVIPHPIY